MLLSRKVGRLWSPAAAASIGRTLVAAAAMGLVVWGMVAVGRHRVGLGRGRALRGRRGRWVSAVYFGVLVLLRSEDVGGPDPAAAGAGRADADRRLTPAEPMP